MLRRERLEFCTSGPEPKSLEGRIKAGNGTKNPKSSLGEMFKNPGKSNESSRTSFTGKAPTQGRAHPAKGKPLKKKREEKREKC